MTAIDYSEFYHAYRLLSDSLCYAFIKVHGTSYVFDHISLTSDRVVVYWYYDHPKFEFELEEIAVPFRIATGTKDELIQWFKDQLQKSSKFRVS